MPLVLGTQTSRASDSITLTIDQGTLPGDFEADYFYISNEEITSEPDTSTAFAVLTTGGNTSVSVSGLEQNKLYWVVAYRHTTGATERATGPVWSSGYVDANYYTIPATLRFTEAWTTEDWSGGMDKWVDEYTHFSENVYTMPDDGTFGSRFLRSRADMSGNPSRNLGTPWRSRMAFDPDQPFSVSTKVRQDWGAAATPTWTTMLCLMESEGGYVQLEYAGYGDNRLRWYCFTWARSTVIHYPGVAVKNKLYDVRIDYNGSGTWSCWVDGVKQTDITGYTPRSPVSLWFFSNNADYGPITASGTAYPYGTGDNHNSKYWTGTFSVLEGNDVGPTGTYSQNMGGITGPISDGARISRRTSTFTSGAWSARSPDLTYRDWSAIRYAGIQSNGSMTVTVRRSSDNAVLLGPWTPASSTVVSQDASSLPDDVPVYILVSGTTTTTGTTLPSRLHFITLDAEPSDHLSVSGTNWSLSGTTITCSSAPIGSPSQATLSVYSSLGGTLAITGGFEVRHPGGEWSSSGITILAGTSTVELSVVPTIAGQKDGTLTVDSVEYTVTALTSGISATATTTNITLDWLGTATRIERRVV